MICKIMRSIQKAVQKGVDVVLLNTIILFDCVRVQGRMGILAKLPPAWPILTQYHELYVTSDCSTLDSNDRTDISCSHHFSHHSEVRSVGVDVTASIKKVADGLGGVEDDDGFAENMCVHHVAWFTISSIYI
jgi:hypothetical protein